MAKLPTIPVIIVGGDRQRRKAVAQAAWGELVSRVGETVIGGMFFQPDSIGRGWAHDISRPFAVHQNAKDMAFQMDEDLAETEMQAGFMFCIDNIFTEYADMGSHAMELQESIPKLDTVQGLVGADGQPLAAPEDPRMVEMARYAVSFPIVQQFLADVSEWYNGGKFFVDDGSPESKLHADIMKGFKADTYTVSDKPIVAARSIVSVLVEAWHLEETEHAETCIEEAPDAV